MNDLFDTPAFKLVRRDDPDTSHDAAESLPVSDMERIVADTIARFGATGAISDKIVDALPHLRDSTITA